MHLEDRLATRAIGTIDNDLAIETAGTQQCGVEHVGAVRCGDQDHIDVGLEAVHLNEQLVERLLALVVATTHAGATMTTDGVDLVDEDDARRVLLRLLEQVTNTTRADANKHLDEVGARDREERHASLARHGTRQQRLAGARRPKQEDTLRDLCAKRLELLRVLQELLDLRELFNSLVGTSHIGKCDLRHVGRHQLGLALAEAHHLPPAALHPIHDEQPQTNEQHERQHVDQQRHQRRATRLGTRDVDYIFVRVVDLVPRLLARNADGVGDGLGVWLGIRSRLKRHLDVVRRGVLLELLDVATLEVGQHRRPIPRRCLGGVVVQQESLGKKRDQDHDHNREHGVSEDAIHTAPWN